MHPNLRVKSKEEAINFVNQRGFIYFWPIKDIILPSLWASVAGERPVADAHDDPGHVTWGWKDALLGERVWYYAKVLRDRATIISLDIAPFFYALSENYGAPDEDYLTLYEQGRLTQEAKQVYEALLEHGILDTVELRKASRLTNPDSDSRFNRALTDLQVDFKILPVGVTDAGAWHYAFAYDIVPRHYPNLPDLAQKISEHEARTKLIFLYLKSVGVARLQDIIKLFRWNANHVGKAIESLINTGRIVGDFTLETQPGTWYAIKNLLQ